MSEYMRENAALLREMRQGEALKPEYAPVDGPRKFYIESYGCQMNFNDSEIVAGILHTAGMFLTTDLEEADIILLNTCAIRDNAEQRVRNRLSELQPLKRKKPDALIGMLGCMAERLKAKLLEEEKLVDLVCGPDAYRTLPQLLASADTGNKAVNVLLSREETYGDISPLRIASNGVTAFISIMRGCDNMCSFCVVPFTRGRERSRSAATIVGEAKTLFQTGFREVTLLGQNVDSYHWADPDSGESISFAKLLALVAQVDPQLRVRFSTSHPRDMTDAVLHTIAEYPNICNAIHLPVQSGSSEILRKMNRTYDREWYLERIRAIRSIIPDCGISTDIIAGFSGESEAQHCETLSLMRTVQFDLAYMFCYSERPGTPAAKKFADDVPEAVKKRRLSEIIELQMQHSLERNRLDIGKTFRVLVEKESKRSSSEMCGRNDQNKMIVFPGNFEPGTYVLVEVTDAGAATLRGTVMEKMACA